MDRNQQAINGFKQRHKVEEFRAALRDGRVAVPDQFHRPIIQGDIVHVGTPNARFWRVAEVVPELSPHVPPGSMRVTLTGQITFICGAGHPLEGICLVVPQEIADLAVEAPAVVADANETLDDTPVDGEPS